MPHTLIYFHGDVKGDYDAALKLREKMTQSKKKEDGEFRPGLRNAKHFHDQTERLVSLVVADDEDVVDAYKALKVEVKPFRAKPKAKPKAAKK